MIWNIGSVPCTPGYQCFGISVEPSPSDDKCPMGGYCNPTGIFTPCPAGTVGTVEAGQSQAHACQVCQAGFYCLSGTTPTTKVSCPMGYYCLTGTQSATSTPCPGGTYYNQLGATSLSECKNCEAGNYCPSGSSSQKACIGGHYCEAQTASAIPCPAGTFSSSIGLTLATQCWTCVEGHYCPMGSTAVIMIVVSRVEDTNTIV